MFDSYMQLLQPPDNRPMLLVRRLRSRVSHLLFLSLSILWQFEMTFSKYWGIKAPPSPPPNYLSVVSNKSAVIENASFLLRSLYLPYEVPHWLYIIEIYTASRGFLATARFLLT